MRVCVCVQVSISSPASPCLLTLFSPAVGVSPEQEIELQAASSLLHSSLANSHVKVPPLQGDAIWRWGL